MKHFLRTIIGLSIILLVLSVTAISCNKVAGDKSNSANNSGGGGDSSGGSDSGSGGTGDGGTGGTGGTPNKFPDPEIGISTVIGKAKFTTKTNDGGKEYDTILINGGELEGTYGVDLTAGLGEIILPTSDRTLGNFFDLTITAGGAGDAKEGLVLVSTGDLASFTNFTTPAVGDTTMTYDSGIYIPNASAVNPDEYKPAGLKFWGIFSDQTVPTSSTLNADPSTDPGTAPFAFTDNVNVPAAMSAARQPILSCRSVITSISSADPASANRATPDKLLTGGQTAKCFMLPRQRFANVGWINSWFTASYVDPTKFKKSFYIAVAGIRTDGKQFKEVLTNFTGGNDDARLAEFMNGLTTDEMEQLARDNIYAYKKILVKIVTPTEYANAPDVNGNAPTLPTASIAIDIANTAEARVEDPTKSDTNIQIKASAFPAIAANSSTTATLADLASAQTGSLKKVFDIKITGGHRDPHDPTIPTGGLVLVGTGDKTAIGDFGTTKPSFTAVDTTFKEGYTTGAPATVAGTAAEYQQAGWNIYGAFMNDTAPNSATTGADNASPFAFSATSGHPSQPFLFCRTTATKLTDPNNTDYHTNDLAGGETATCYIGSKGTALNDAAHSQAADWLAATAGNNFKKKFKIFIGAIRTDGDPVNQIITGMTLTQKEGNFQDGLSKAELENIMTRYPSGFKTISVEIVANGAF